MAGFGYERLPDVGELSYNGVTFTSLFRSRVTMEPVEDNAMRTTRCGRLKIVAEGSATLLTPNGELVSPGETIDTVMAETLRRLKAKAGRLAYKGKGLGNDLVVNDGAAGKLRDIAFGPTTKVLEFQPMGASRSALVSWQAEALIPLIKGQVPVPVFVNGDFIGVQGAGGGAALTGVGALVQFNEECSVSYDEDNHATLTFRGTIEVPITRPTVNDRVVLRGGVDAYRKAFLNFPNDLLRYRVVRRNFTTSRDRRTCEYEMVLEELPRMGLPFGASRARGTFSVKNHKVGNSLLVNFLWICSLRGTYSINKVYPARWAWAAFVTLLKFRMEQSVRGNLPNINNPLPGQQQPPPVANPVANPNFQGALLLNVAGNPLGAFQLLNQARNDLQAGQQAAQQLDPKNLKPLLTNFGFDEGLYLDSRETVTFEATWRLVTGLDRLLLATGVWKYSGVEGGVRWARSTQELSGWKGNLACRLNADFIVDLGDAQ